MPAPPVTYPTRNKRWLTQEVANLVAIDLDGDGIVDALNINIKGAQLQFPPEVEITNDYGNPVPVSIVSGSGIAFLEFGSSTSIPANSLTTVLTHTVATSPLFLTNFFSSGELDAEVSFYVNTVRKLVWRTSEQQRNAEVPIGPLRFPIGTILDIKVVHFYTGKTADFEASLVGYK